MITILALAMATALPKAETLEAAVAAYDVAQTTGDRHALERLLADDYSLVNSGGAIETKAQFIADLTDPSYHLAPFRVVAPIERSWSDGAVRGGLARLTGTSAGKAFDACLRFVDVWRRAGGRWQVAFSHATRAEEADCRK